MRGRRVKTTCAPVHSERPDDRVNRDFKVNRPNALWVSDLTYVATWRGFSYTAFVIDAHARRIVGGRVSNSLHTDLALNALEQVLHERLARRKGFVHQSVRGVQPLSMRYTERLSAQVYSTVLVEFKYRFNRRFDLPNIIPRLVYVALTTPPMPERLLKLNLA